MMRGQISRRSSAGLMERMEGLLWLLVEEMRGDGDGKVVMVMFVIVSVVIMMHL